MSKSIAKLLTKAALCLLLALPLLRAGESQAQIKTLRGDMTIEETTTAPAVPQVLERRSTKTYRQQPPLIPHRIDRYEIDMKVNQCVRCHDWPGNVEENAPKMSETHYIDREGVALERVARTRWFCNQCHVPQTDAPALVGNSFRPLTRGQ